MGTALVKTPNESTLTNSAFSTGDTLGKTTQSNIPLLERQIGLYAS
jgi:hypothetical protein